MHTPDEIKTDMMSLWKETFHDSDRYISLVFDTYFNPDNICVRYDDNRLVASLLGVPYRFYAGSAGDRKELCGLYLCGLATRPEYRRRGIMSEMMEEISQRVADRNFDLTFLIPADDHLRQYYRHRGYFDMSRRENLRFKNSESMGECSPHLVRTLIENDDVRSVHELADWCVAREAESSLPALRHSVEDMVAVLSENENAIFFTDCAYGREYPNLANLVAIAFPEDSDEVMADDILKRNPKLPFSWTFRNIFVKSVGECNVSSSDIDSVDAGPYAMARLLPHCKIPKDAFPRFSVSLLLD